MLTAACLRHQNSEGITGSKGRMGPSCYHRSR